jgi:Zn-dependent M28 family amino/carboxypeptidase
LNSFILSEKPAVVIEGSRGDNGLIFVGGSQAYKQGEPDGVPWLYMAAEHFNRIVRLVDRKVPVQIEVEVKSQFESGDGNSWNTIAEIPGTDKKDELVMTGAHIDSWHAGTGATDDGAGVAVTMEAMRILLSLGVKPRRTIRIGLWGGEEQGLLGSRAYATDHLGKREVPPRAQGADNGLPSFMRPEQGKLVLKPEQAKVSAYFNIDNGTGKLRGIYTQENSMVAPIFAAWGAPFRDLGFTTITNRNTGGTDHLSFDAVGVPGFQFIQDPVEYMSRTHHSNMDVYDRIQREDMMQASAILAAFLYDAAMRDDMMPRKALPKDAEMEQAKPEPAKDAKPAKKERKK